MFAYLMLSIIIHMWYLLALTVNEVCPCSTSPKRFHIESLEVVGLLEQLEPSSPNHLYACACAANCADDSSALAKALAAWLGRHGVLQAR